MRIHAHHWRRRRPAAIAVGAAISVAGVSFAPLRQTVATLHDVYANMAYLATANDFSAIDGQIPQVFIRRHPGHHHPDTAFDLRVEAAAYQADLQSHQVVVVGSRLDLCALAMVRAMHGCQLEGSLACSTALVLVAVLFSASSKRDE